MLAAGAGALISTGGVSMGDADVLRPWLEQQGALTFHRLALKPGRPFSYGMLQGQRAILTFREPRFRLCDLSPARRSGAAGACRGRLVRHCALRDATKAVKRLRAPRFSARHFTPTAQSFSVEAFDAQDSHLLSGLAAANCLLDLPLPSGDLPAGAEVTFLPLA